MNFTSGRLLGGGPYCCFSSSFNRRPMASDLSLRRPIVRTWMSELALLALAGLASAAYVECYMSHFCKGGHMAHPPYSNLDRLMEVAWLGAFAASVALAWVIRARHRLVTSAIVVALVYSRIQLESRHGLLPTLELPLLVTALVLIAVAPAVTLVRWHRQSSGGPPPPEPASGPE